MKIYFLFYLLFQMHLQSHKNDIIIFRAKYNHE